MAHKKAQAWGPKGPVKGCGPKAALKGWGPNLSGVGPKRALKRMGPKRAFRGEGGSPPTVENVHLYIYGILEPSE